MAGNEASSAKGPPEPLEEVAARLGPKLEEAKARVDYANERVKAFIRKNPGSTLLGAALLGFLVGRWASRDD